MHIKPVIAGVLGLSLAACAQQQVPLQSIGYNKGFGDARNAEILLNIVRAADREPMYFTSTGGMTFKDAAEGKLKLDFPLVGTGFENFTITPSANFSSGMNGYKVDPLNQNKFIQFLHTPMKFSDIAFYLQSGWRPELIFNLVLNKISISDKNYRSLERHTDIFCNEGRVHARSEKYCLGIEVSRAQLKEFLRKNPNWECTLPKGFGKNKIRAFHNHGNNPCQYVYFQNLIRQFLVLDVEITHNSNDSEKDKPQMAMMYLFDDEGAVLSSFNLTDNRPSKKNSLDSLRTRETVTQRSVQEIIYYLGEVTRTNFYNPDYPDLFISQSIGKNQTSYSENDIVQEIMTIKRSAKAPLGSAYQVRKGLTSYYVPETGSNITKTALTFVKQILEFAIQENDIPDRNVTVNFN